MRLLMLVLCLAAVALLAGCLPNELQGGWPGSLYPMYTSDEEVSTDPTLVGEWRDDSDPEHPVKWFFKKDEIPGLGIVKGDDHLTYMVQLVKSGDLVFLDTVQLENGGGGDLFSLRVGLHVFLRVQKNGDQLRVSALDSDWYLQQLERKQFPLRIERLGEGVPAITSPPAEVRAYFTKVATDPHAFTEIATLRRYRPPAGAH